METLKLSNMKLNSYTDITANPNLAAVMLEILKRLESQFGSISEAPRCKYIFKGLSVKGLSLKDLYEAAIYSGDLITVAVEGDHYGVIFDYRYLDYNNLFATLEEVVKPKGQSWNTWLKMQKHLADHPFKIFYESNLSHIIQDPAAQGYHDYHDRNPRIRRILIGEDVYYVYIP